MAGYEEPTMGGRGAAQAQVSGPAIGLLVTGILGIVVQVLGIAYNLTLGPQMQKMQLEQMQKQDPKMAEQMEQQMEMLQMFTGGIGMAMAVLGIIIGVVIILGAVRMKNLQSYGMAMTSSILAIIPCLSPCCLLGLPIGIWALVVLSKPDVKEAFQRPMV